MPDQRIIDYIRQNQKTHPIAALKKALIQNGFPPAEVEEGVRLVMGPSAPPAPAPSPHPIVPGAAAAPEARPAAERAAPEGGGLELHPKNMIANAVFMFKDAEGFFSRLNPKGSAVNALLNIVLWTSVSMVITYSLTLLKMTPGIPGIRSGFGLIALPFMLVAGVIVSFVFAAIYHVFCMILGTQLAFQSSLTVVGALAALGPPGAVANVIPFGGSAMLVVWCYFAVNAASGLHKIGKKKAGIVFGCITAFFLLISISATFARRKLQGMARSGDFSNMLGAQIGKQIAAAQARAVPAGAGPVRDFPGGTPSPRSANPNAQTPADAGQAMRMANQMMAQMGTPEQQKEFQHAMTQAAQQSTKIMGELNRYAKMKRPPRKTLSLLNSKGKRRLKKAWPTVAAPVRKSLVEALPKIKRSRRTRYLENMLQQTKQMNDAMNQSMQMLQGVMQGRQQRP